jgi:hypothetical protein
LKTAPALMVGLGLIAGCAHPPKVSTAISIKRKSADVVAIVLEVKNLEKRPTVPILVNVAAELHTANGWSRPDPVIHPAAFVLNRNETQIFGANLKATADGVRTLLVVKEAETGHVLKTERAQLAVPST